MSLAAYADKPLSLSLHEAILLGLRYNADVKNAEIERVVQKFALRSAFHDFERQYALSGNFVAEKIQSAGVKTSVRTIEIAPLITQHGVYGTSYILSTIPESANGIYNPGIQLQVSQPLMRGFGKAIATNSLYLAKESEKINKLKFQEQLLQTVAEIINAYRNVVASQNTVIIDTLSLKAYRDAMILEKVLVQAGKRPGVELIQAKADVKQALFTLENDKSKVMQDKLTLQNLIGLPQEISIEVSSEMMILQQSISSFDEIYQTALRNNVNYLVQVIVVNCDKRKLLASKDAARPELDVGVRGATSNVIDTVENNNEWHLVRNRNTNIALTLNAMVPIDDYTLKQAIMSDEATLQQDRITRENLKRQLKITLKKDADTIYANLHYISLARVALQLEAQNQKILMERLKYGLVGAFEASLKQRDLDKARAQYIQAKINYLNALTQLYLDMGVLLNKWYIQVRE